MTPSYLIKYIILIIIFNFIIPQNFIYESEDWLIVKSPGSVYSITEGPFNVYFGTENGIYSYDKFDEFIEYDFQLNQGLDEKSQI